MNRYVWTDTPLRGNRDTGCTEWPGSMNKMGYGQVRWQGKVTLAHRLVYAAIIGPIPEGMDVLHRCDNPPCVNSDHLFLGTHADNMADRDAKGRQSHGETHYAAKLTEDAVRVIRGERLRGASLPELARRFGVHPVTVGDVTRGRTWKHVAVDSG